MVKKISIKGLIFVLIILSVVWIVLAAGAPQIISWGNDKTNGVSISFTVNLSESVTFNATVNQTVTGWKWSVDDAERSSNPNNFNYQFINLGSHTIKVNVTNGTETSNTIIWTINVQPLPDRPAIISWGNDKTNNASLHFDVNVTETVFFNATANQTITTWKWLVDDINRNNNLPTFSYQFNTGGSHTIKVDVTNGNGTSDTQKWTVQVADSTPPSNITNLVNISGPTWINWTWTNPTSDFDHAEVYFDDSFVMNTIANNYNATSLLLGTTHIISLRPVDAVGNVGNWANRTADTVPNPPTIVLISPTETSFETIGTGTKNFTIKVVDQTANVIWTGAKSQTDSNIPPGTLVNLTFSPSTPGTYDINVSASNANGTSTPISWTWIVRSKTYETGNRVWDSSKGMNTRYTWNPMSFYAFYYDVNDNVGNESLQINLAGPTTRSVGRDQLIYKTAPEDVTFKYKGWGTYKVIGFMADKYFAAYTSRTSNDIIKGTPVSPMGYSQLHKVLMDDKDTHTIRTSTTYPLGDGYAVTLKDIGAGREAMISILKDNGEIYFDIVGVGETLVYSKKVGSVSDLPLIALHVGSVFQGTTDNMVQIDGIFQISESYISANSGNRYSMMEITDTSETGITMKNRNSFTLSSGSTIDIMGDIKFIVARSDTVLRFAPMIKRSGEYEVRGSISNNETENEWTPLNFEGFYYNLDEDVGTEKLTLKRTDRTIAKGDLVYNTTSQAVSFKYKGLGQYNVIGFMADKYFAGYLAGSITPNPISTMERNQLHKVLIDDDTQRVIYAGSTLTLNDGYVIKIKDVNMGAGDASVWLVLLKDGNEVFDDFKEKGQIFKYEKDVGVVKDLPIIALRIDSIFRGKEATAAFVKGTFQISESYTSVNSGDRFDRMEVSDVTSTQIKMTNPSVVTLSSGSTIDFMKNVKFRVADSPDIRFYPYIMVNGSALAENQLAINVPSSLMVRDVITISVSSGAGTPQDNVEVSFDGNVIGTTNSTGKLEYMLTKAGQHNFTATKLGYESAIKAVQIAEYVDNRLNFELPEFIDQYIPVLIKVKVSGSGNAISGANITLDGTGIGKTDTSGTLSYTFTASGKHNLAASRSGYITVQREIDVRMPFTEFKALDINFRPDVVNRGQKVYVWSNITNSGTKEGTLPVALIINDTVVENSNVTLAPGKNGEVNFSHRIELPAGNYTVEILGKKTTMPVRDEPINLFLVGGVVTGLGVIAIYFMTSKDLISIEALKAKLNLGVNPTNQEIINRQAVDNALKNLMLKFKK